MLSPKPSEPAKSITLLKNVRCFHRAYCSSNHLVEGMDNDRVKLIQELHLRNLHRDFKTTAETHSCLHCHDQALDVE